jgi:predicted AAA+ superfamily ATPase
VRFGIASKNAEFLDYAKMGSKARVQQKTATRFFEILEDTMLVRRLEAFSKVSFRRLIQHPKYYFFDCGVLNALLGNFRVSEDRKGLLFETFVVNQVAGLIEAFSQDLRMSTYRTEAGAKVDIILEREGEVSAIEIKNTTNIGRADLNGFKSFADVCPGDFQKAIIYTGKDPQRIQDVEIWPVIQGFNRLTEWIA